MKISIHNLLKTQRKLDSGFRRNDSFGCCATAYTGGFAGMKHLRVLQHPAQWGTLEPDFE
jgi:hypothetical protein